MALRSTAGGLPSGTVITPTQGGKPSNRFTNFTNTTSFSTTSATLVMGGYGSSWKLTPATTGNVRVRVTGNFYNSSASVSSIKGYFGTGTAPTQGAAVTGTAGSTTAYIAPDQLTGTGQGPITIEFEVTGLTLSTAYWFDVAASTAASSANFTAVSVIIEEF